ncbi:MAG: hypothetical protein IKP60_08705 [Treponema sp.]|nr:hypothetical protein [Treponema sp.]
MERKTSGRVLGLRKTVFALSLLLTGTVATFAQTSNATYVRNFINSQGQCKTGALTSSNGCVAIVGGNGYVASGIPQSLNEHLAAESRLEEPLTTSALRKMEASTVSGILCAA